MKAKPVSFFDEENLKPIKKLWAKPPKEKNEQPKLNPVVCLEFLKICKKKGKGKPRFLILEDNYLYMCKTEKKKKVSGVIELTVAKCEWLFLEDPSSVF